MNPKIEGVVFFKACWCHQRLWKKLPIICIVVEETRGGMWSQKYKGLTQKKSKLRSFVRCHGNWSLSPWSIVFFFFLFPFLTRFSSAIVTLKWVGDLASWKPAWFMRYAVFVCHNFHYFRYPPPPIDFMYAKLRLSKYDNRVSPRNIFVKHYLFHHFNNFFLDVRNVKSENTFVKFWIVWGIFIGGDNSCFSEIPVPPGICTHV